MKYIICGLEHVGLRVAQALLDLNEEVSVITLHKDESNLFYIRNRLTHYVEGDARYTETLKLAGIDNADFLLIFTSNELKNIEINCQAKEVNPTIKTALLIKSISNAKIIEQGFDTNFVFHLPSIVSLPIVSACINRNILHTISCPSNNYYFSTVSAEDYPFLINQSVKNVENDFGIININHFSPKKNTASPLETNLITKESRLVYVSNTENPFNKHNYVSQKTNPDLVSETSKRFSFFNDFSISYGLYKVILLYTILIVSSVFIFNRFLHLSVIDSLYFVITTTSTVGYGDLNLLNSPFWIKLYGCFLMLAGAALLATLFSVLTDNIISKRLGGFVGILHRKMKNHIIVAGMGSIGIEVVNYLIKMGVKTVVIDKNPDNPNIALLRNKIPVLIGDASERKILEKAGIKKARALASLIDNDLNNINIILKGAALKDELHTVARIFSNELHKKAQSTFQIDNVISASGIAVPFIINSLHVKNLLWAGYILNNCYALYSIHLNASSPITGWTKKQMTENYEINLLLVKRNEKLIYFDETMICKDDDLLYLFSDYQSIKKLKLNISAYNASGAF